MEEGGDGDIECRKAARMSLGSLVNKLSGLENSDVIHRKDISIDIVRIIRVATGARTQMDNVDPHSTSPLELLDEFKNTAFVNTLAEQLAINFDSTSLFLKTVSVEIFTFLISLMWLGSDDEPSQIKAMSENKFVHNAAEAFVRVLEHLINCQLHSSSTETPFDTEALEPLACDPSYDIEDNISICLFTLCSNALPFIFKERSNHIVQLIMR